ncbi:hypothetical protein AT746_14620 [Lacimicrobium alkaliphilum]|uniref:Uncharacterized protein n=1 Tax=Lacimicrobium alkaliphilum TaxID=1526571 RepID=A0A0U3B292_9ALTE|nr:hypothetical protein AT746_14620 [Lacimicrobium alkaliphilum]
MQFIAKIQSARSFRNCNTALLRALCDSAVRNAFFSGLSLSYALRAAIKRLALKIAPGDFFVSFVVKKHWANILGSPINWTLHDIALLPALCAPAPLREPKLSFSDLAESLRRRAGK